MSVLRVTRRVYIFVNILSVNHLPFSFTIKHLSWLILNNVPILKSRKWTMQSQMMFARSYRYSAASLGFHGALGVLGNSISNGVWKFDQCQA